MRLNKLSRKTFSNYTYNVIVIFAILCILPLIPFYMVYYLEVEFAKIMGVATYLTWHNLFEFASILVSVSVFLVAYYSYDQTARFKSIYLGSVFLTVALVDAFHTLSYKGMPDFFIANTTANRATIFWIISRFIFSTGFIFAGYIGKTTKKINKNVFLIVPFCVSIAILIAVTWFPDIFPTMYEEGTGLTEFKKNSELVIIFLFFISGVKFVHRYFLKKETLELVSAFSMVLSIYSEMAFTQYSSVYDIYNYLGHIYKFLAFFVIFRVIFITNIRRPYIELYEAKYKIKSYADNLDLIVQKRTQELRKLNEQLMEDLRYAKDIQKAMYPSRLPKYKEVIFDSRYFAADMVSGDFYSVFKRDEENVALFIGDVSGHGVPAAMLTVFVNQTVRTLIDAQSGTINPSEVLNSIYKSFNKTNFSEEVYIVMIYGLYNVKKRELIYSSAGHNVEPLVIKESGIVEEINITGFPICKFAEYYDGEYKDNVLVLDPKDKVFFYTDGLIEARNTEGDFYSKERLIDLLKTNSNKSCKDINKSICRSLFEFTGKYALKDDVTFFILEVSDIN
ncbi:MAG: SpoIIE family protein phosphatase [Clostridiaceae bacterium]|mgnify:CR=1 FL=1|nr:SpoIIE family protein phosphatase [Clostridiaceae bacterium]